MDRKLLSHVALFVVALLYGGNYIIAKDVMHKELLQPLAFVLLRDLTACGIFWIFHTVFIREVVKRKDIPRLILCGLLGVALNQSLFFSGLELTTPIHASLIMTSGPVLVLIASHFILKERITGRKLLGIFIACCGAILLVAREEHFHFAENTVMGDIMVLLNAAFYGLYLVLVKSLVDRYHPLTVITWVFTFGAMFMLPAGARQLVDAPWAIFTSTDWLFILYVLIGVTVIAYLFNVLALKHVTPNVVAIYIYLQPVFAATLSVIFLGEPLGPVKVVSAAAIFSGVYLVSVKKR